LAIDRETGTLKASKDKEKGNADNEGEKSEKNGVETILLGENQKCRPDNIADDDQEVAFEWEWVDTAWSGKKWFERQNKSAENGDEDASPFFFGKFFVQINYASENGKDGAARNQEWSLNWGSGFQAIEKGK